MNNNTLLLILLEIATIIGLARLVGLLFFYFKQPQVMGEIVAGIMLGPSLLGWIAPNFFKTLFPSTTTPFLYLLSQIGLIFFMFLVGLELNPKYLRHKLKIAILTSNISILLPFILGVILAFTILYKINNLSQVSFVAFALFVGAAMSITAFPVLARILTDKKLAQTPLGTLALTCASVDDISAWCLLAIAITVTRTNNVLGAIPTILYIGIYGTVMIVFGRKVLKRLVRSYDRTGQLEQWLLTLIYIAVILSAVMTEWIGIDVIFGGFLLGAVMPKNIGLTNDLTAKTEDFVSTFLLPIFFAYSGLNTQFNLLNTPYLWGICGLVILAAIVGKYVGVYGTTRFYGVEKREAQALGWLMNTRGLTELIILNVGLQLKVISPVIFTMFVIMALVTTLITSPLVEWVYPKSLVMADNQS
ncbi:MAG: cation:proton antiporter [Snowella sp.]|nr:cation:proton antiporter [Snowella sp.]